MSASSLLEQVQAQPACFGHCVRRDGARLGPGPPLLAGPRRRLSRVGIRASGRPRPEPPRLVRSSRSSPGRAGRLAAPRSLPPISGPGFPSSFPSPSLLVSPPAVPGRLSGLALFPAGPSPRVPPRPVPFFPAPALLSFVFPFPFSSRTTWLLGDVPSSRRDQKVKETKVSPAPPGTAGRDRGVRRGGGVSGTRPGKRTFPEPLSSQVPRAGRSTLLECSCSWRAAFSLTRSNS